MAVALSLATPAWAQGQAPIPLDAPPSSAELQGAPVRQRHHRPPVHGGGIHHVTGGQHVTGSERVDRAKANAFTRRLNQQAVQRR